jgi:hypothetical protein
MASPGWKGLSFPSYIKLQSSLGFLHYVVVDSSEVSEERMTPP